MDLDKLEQLESCIDRLLELQERLKTARSRAETRLHERDAEFKGLNDRLQRRERERAALRERLDRIIGAFEDLDLS